MSLSHPRQRRKPQAGGSWLFLRGAAAGLLPPGVTDPRTPPAPRSAPWPPTAPLPAAARRRSPRHPPSCLGRVAVWRCRTCSASRPGSRLQPPATHTHSAMHVAGGLSGLQCSSESFGSQGRGRGQLTLQVGALDIRLADRPIRRRAVGDREAVLGLSPASESCVSGGYAKGSGSGRANR